MQPFPLLPHYTHRPWGGTRLIDLGKSLPESGGPFGESWELSDHPDGPSRIAGTGPLAGSLFGDALRREAKAMLGVEKAPTRYPLLVKYIDAAGDLSVQVHPDNTWCVRSKWADLGKSECWYVMDCAPGAEVILGMAAWATPEVFREAITTGRLSELLVRRTICPGSFLTLPPGTVHAMLAGTLVCEIQQSSNTTFRVYDWDRKPARELHIEQSIAVSNYNAASLPPIQELGAEPSTLLHAPQSTLLVANEYFTITAIDVPAGETAVLEPEHGHGAILNAVVGVGTLLTPLGDLPIHRGETWWLPAAAQGLRIAAPAGSSCRVLLTESLEIGRDC